MVLADIGMSVPILVVMPASGIDFDKADAALNKTAREQAAPAKILRQRIVQAVEFFRFQILGSDRRLEAHALACGRRAHSWQCERTIPCFLGCPRRTFG